MKPFEYAAPETLEEATALLSERWGESEILAGGMDLITSLKQGITAPDRVISLRKLSGLKRIWLEDDTLKIGATVPLAQAAEHETMRQEFPSLVSAIHEIRSPQMIAQGTVGGDLCQRPRCWYFRNGYGLFGRQGETSLVLEGDNRYHAIFGNDGPAYFVHPSSLGPGLIALDATIVAIGAEQEERAIPAGEFFKTPEDETDRETVLRPNEILTRVEIPLKGLRNATYEVRHRQAFDWPYVTATVAFQEDGGRASDGRVVLGHVAPTPWPAKKAGEALTGTLNEAKAGEAAEAATHGAQPLDGNRYKVRLVKSAVKRALLVAADRS